MIINNINNAYAGNSQVNAIYLGETQVWPVGGFWTFDRTSSNLTGFSVTTSTAENISINWGDSSSDTISSGQTINHTYTS